MDKEQEKQQIRLLIEKLRKTIEEKRTLKEEATKTDLILPLFRALGWNVEDSNEVSKEEKVSKKRVDYGFRINGIPKFFLEAKSLDEDLNGYRMVGGEKITYVNQAINYAWYKGCTWAVLTNFKEIRLLNAEVKDVNNTFISLSFEQFIDNFEKLWLLSKESFLSGLIDKEAEGWGKKTKKISIDKQLLVDFTRFRELLSKNITRLNDHKKMSDIELDESVQRIFDRLIFIRNAEDKELEEKILILNLREWAGQSKTHLIDYVRKTFKYFDERYNSNLFKEHLCDSLNISDDVLKEIISGLYETKDKSVFYDFALIEADVLGNIYEQYLGYILRKTKKRAKLTEAHAHRKEHGIYYTPTYVVDYIVRNTLGELLKNRKVDADKIKILDPACGSGSFLIKVFDVLNEYHSRKDKNYNQKTIASDGTTFSVKERILKNNIFGVDLDKQAVEIAQLNLLLKIAEKKKLLPMLHNNIKCGNSLIDDPAVAGDKAFKWQEEFKQIMDEGGFDVVVGNPPYISYYGSDAINLSAKERTYYKDNYETVKKENERLNAFWLFLERGTKLLKEGGYLSFIINKTLLVLPSYKNIRKYLIENFEIVSIVPELDPFDVVVDATIIILKKSKKIEKTRFISYHELKETKPKINEVSQKSFMDNSNYELIFKPRSVLDISKKMGLKSIPLKERFITSRGVNIGGRAQFFLKDSQFNDKTHKYLLGSQNVSRYNLKWPSIQTNDKYNFLLFDIELEKKLKKEGATIVLGQESRFNKPKLIINEASNIVTGVYDELDYYCSYSFHVINGDPKEDLKYLLGILNSKLITYYCITNEILRKGTKATPHLGTKGLDRLPIKFDEKHKLKIIHQVDKMLSFNKRLNEIGDKKTDEGAKIEEEIKKTDAEIDELVYEIYGISEAEKKIIEESLK